MGDSVHAFRLLCCVFAVVVCEMGTTPSRADPLVTVPRIMDADTVDAGTVKIRLNGMDAPESDQRCLDAHGTVWNCGLDATAKLEAYTHGRPWSCQLTGADRYGRAIGTCFVNGEDVNRWLVRNGWVLAFRRYSTIYVADEDYAREHQLGLWSGAFIAPWDWRHRGPETIVLGAYQVPTTAQRDLLSPALAATPPNPTCVIKSNFKSRDGCIYHVPGGHFYDRLTMEPGSGPRWFCTEAEAQAAGCRRSKL
jgi:endonuclease YncB( thermonuclease family)